MSPQQQQQQLQKLQPNRRGRDETAEQIALLEARKR